MPELKKTFFQNTVGLVLCGGNSIRMGSDKSMLQYYEKPQRYHVYQLLQPFCETVFISCNKMQVPGIEPEFNFIQDDAGFTNIGPMAALLSACNLFPEKNILLIGCDYPFLTSDELAIFSTQLRETASAFYNEEANFYEPLLAWYPASSFRVLRNMYKEQQFSLQQFLVKSQAARYYPVNKNSIVSVDTADNFVKVKAFINR